MAKNEGQEPRETMGLESDPGENLEGSQEPMEAGDEGLHKAECSFKVFDYHEFWAEVKRDLGPVKVGWF
jgi:hypothetical protein